MTNFTKTISLVFLMFLSSLGYSQTLLGNGTNTEQQLPFSAHYLKSYGQSIYLASEIAAYGQITTLQWYYTGNYNFSAIDNVTISLGNTTKSEFNSLTDWETTENLTQVYTGTISASGPGWITIEFTTPFEYTETANLIVAVQKTTEFGGNITDKFYNSEVSTNRSLVAFCNSCAVPNTSTPGTTFSNYVPNIIIGDITPACPTPGLLSIQEVTHSSATINWQQDGVPSLIGNEYYISESNNAPDAATTSGTIDSGGLIDNLEVDTKYYVWVRSICDFGAGPWSFAVSFTTACATLNSFSEDFEDTPINQLPSCWSSILREGTSSAAYVKTMSGQASSGTQSMHLINSDSATGSDIILVSPTVGTTISSHRLKFSAKGLPAGTIEIGTLNGSGPESEFTLFQPQAITNVHTEYTIDFATYVGNDTHIGIRMNTLIPYTNVYLDAIRWEVTPPCSDVTLVTIPVATPVSATVAWEAGDGISEWDIVYGASTETDPNTLLATLVNVSGNPQGTLLELTPNTGYKAWVRTVCTGGTGVWIGPIDFTTPCLAVNSITEDFESAVTPALPNCWAAIKRGGNNAASASITTDTSDPQSGLNAVKLNNNFANTATDDILLVSPNLGNLAAGTHRLKFFAKDNGNGHLEVVTLNSATNAAAYTFFQAIQTTATYTEYKVDFTTYEGTDTFIGFRNVFGAYESVFIDSISWEPAPACPDAVEISFDDITNNSVAMSWDASITAPNWEVVFADDSDTDPNTLEAQTVTDTAVSLNDLSANTTYYAWIRSDCGEQTGDWIGPIQFTTACAAVTSLNEGFEGIGNELPSCWSTILRGPTVSETVTVSNLDSDAITGTNSIVFYNEPNYNVDDIILVTPYLSNIASGTSMLKFNSYQIVYAYSMKIMVGTLNNNSSTATFTPFQEFILTDVPAEYTVDFSSYTGTDKYIGFRYITSDEGSGLIYLDDVKWQSDLSIEGNTLSNLRYYPNPVKNILNFTHTKDISAISVYNILGQKVMETTPNSNTVQVDLSGLATGSYVVKVTSDHQTKTLKMIKQ